MITALTLRLGFFKMSYTCARTCIFTGCTAAAAGHIHAIHFEEEAHVYSAGILALIIPICCGSSKRNQENAGHRTDGRGCHFGSTFRRHERLKGPVCKILTVLVWICSFDAPPNPRSLHASCGIRTVMQYCPGLLHRHGANTKRN